MSFDPFAAQIFVAGGYRTATPDLALTAQARG